MRYVFSEEDCASLSNPDYNPEEDPNFDVDDLWIPKKEDLTCFDCPLRKECYWVDDLYNTDGDCLALK